MGASQSNQPRPEVRVQLASFVFLPGNVIQGSVSLNYGRPVSVTQLGALLTCELHQHWTTTHRYTTGSGKNRRSHTRTQHHYKTTPLVKLTIQIPHQGTAQPGQQFPFTYVLDPGSLPTIDRIEKCKLRYYFQGVYQGADTKGQSVLGVPTAFQVLLPMSAMVYNNPAPRQEEKTFDLVCCCCINKGKCTATFSMSKTVIALDRDSVMVSCRIDNTHGEAECENVVFTLSCMGQVKVGHICSFGDTAGAIKVPANVKAGQTRDIQGVIQLNPLHPPSFQSTVVDITYNVTATLDMSMAADVRAAFPVFVAHTVDMSNMIAQFQQAYNTFQPIQENAMPVMYQAPAQPNQAMFDMQPPEMFTSMPPIQFAQLPADGEGAPPPGYDQMGGGGSPMMMGGGGGSPMGYPPADGGQQQQMQMQAGYGAPPYQAPMM